MRVVTFFLQEVPHYRVAFLDQLQSRLLSRGIQLKVLYGGVPNDGTGRAVTFDRPWAREVRTIAMRWWNIDIVWQTGWSLLRHSDLIVIEQSNRLLINYLLQLRRCVLSTRLAYWGHGRNWQTKRPNGLRERWKKSLIGAVDWWFAYTESTRDYVRKNQFPDERITVVNNSTDDQLLRAGLTISRRLPRLQVRKSLCLGGGPVALYCGTLQAHKRIDFLIAAAEKIRAALPTFELMVIGDGPERMRIEAACRAHAWIRYDGAVFGADCAKYWNVSDVVLIPGPVGLVLVDSFVAECPLVTTRDACHSPEIVYLRSGENGLVTEPSINSYVNAVVNLLRDPIELEKLRSGCRASAEQYSLSAMVDNVATGVSICLSTNNRDRVKMNADVQSAAVRSK